MSTVKAIYKYERFHEHKTNTQKRQKENQATLVLYTGKKVLCTTTKNHKTKKEKLQNGSSPTLKNKTADSLFNHGFHIHFLDFL